MEYYSSIKRNGSFPSGASDKESACQRRRCGFNPWVGKITWRRTWQPTPVFLPGESTDRGDWQATVHSVPKSWTRLKQLSMRAHTNGKDLVLFL